MAGDIKVANVSGFMATGASSAKNFTVTGFGTVAACIVTLTFDTTDDANSQTEYKICIGFTDFTNQRFLSAQTEDGSGSEDANIRKGVNDGYSLLTVSGGDDGHGDISAITDGVRLTNQAAFSRAAFVNITLFGGADISVDVGSHPLTNNAVGNTNATTTGIDADIIYFIGADRSQEDSTGNAIGNSFGIASTGREASQSIVNRCTSYTVDQGNAAGAPGCQMENNRCLSIISQAGGQDWAIELTAADATSFTTTIREVGPGGGHEVYYLALALDPGGTRVKSEVGSIDSPVVSGDWSKTGLGFEPQYVHLGLNRCSVEDTIFTGDSQAGSFGISHNSGSGEEGCHSWYDEQGAATINANNCFRSRAIYLFEHDGTTIAYDLSHSSFESDGWVYTQVGTPNATAAKWFYCAIAKAAAAVLSGSLALVGVGR